MTPGVWATVRRWLSRSSAGSILSGMPRSGRPSRGGFEAASKQNGSRESKVAGRGFPLGAE
jgi:hypothetical protein